MLSIAYCDHIARSPLLKIYIGKLHRLLLPCGKCDHFQSGPKVITLSSFHCNLLKLASIVFLEPLKIKEDSFNIDELINQVLDYENGGAERNIDPESYLYLTALITPILGVNPQCYNDSLTYVRALNNLTSPDFMWALKSKNHKFC